MDKLAFLDGPEGSNDDAHIEDAPVEAPVAEPETPQEPKDEQPRDERGQFAPKGPAEAEPTPAPQPVVEAKPEPIMVPLAALQEVRDELKTLKAAQAAPQPQEPPKPVELPDMFEDPQGYTAAIQQQVQGAIYGERLNISHRFAVSQHGAELVEKAMEWGQARCASDPHFNATVMSNPDPVEFAVQQFQRDQIASQVSPDEFQQFQAWRAAQGQIAQQQQAAPAASTETPMPPTSIASAPSAGGAQHVATGPGVAFDETFRN